MLKDKYKKESAASKMSSNWDFLVMLYNRGRAKAHEWLEKNFAFLSISSIVNLREQLVGKKNRAKRDD